MRAAACASVRLAEFSNGLVLGVIGTATPAFLPGSAGPWKWAIVAGPLSPGKMPLQGSFFLPGSEAAGTLPGPFLSFGGTASPALTSAFNEGVSGECREA